MKVNGCTVAPAEPTARLLDFLRDDLGLTGAKEGCAMGECGACTVLIDGAAVCSCLVLVGQLPDSDIVTVEGLVPEGELHPVQRAVIDHHASQCGYCTPGVVVAAAALLAEDATPDDEAILAALEGNLCRCTGYQPIIDAVRSVAR